MKAGAVWIVLFALMLAGCGIVGNTPDPLPTVVLGSNNPAPANPTAGQPATPEGSPAR